MQSIKKYLIWVLISYVGLIQAEAKYFLCGSDEDGCYPGGYSSCLCMPEDAVAAEPYCLDYTDPVSCLPLTKMPNCPPHDIKPNQSNCLATAFQSEPNPPCPLVSESFCLQHHIVVCAADRGVGSCAIE